MSHWTNLPEFQFQADFLLDLEWFSSLLERWSEQINLRFIKPTKGSPITLSREHGERPFNVQAAAGKLRLERPFSFHRHLTSDLGERSWKNESDSDSGSWLVSDSRSRSLLSARGVSGHITARDPILKLRRILPLWLKSSLDLNLIITGSFLDEFLFQELIVDACLRNHCVSFSCVDRDGYATEHDARWPINTSGCLVRTWLVWASLTCQSGD